MVCGLHTNLHRQIFSLHNLGLMAPVLHYDTQLVQRLAYGQNVQESWFDSRGATDTFLISKQSGPALQGTQTLTERKPEEKRPQPEAYYLSSFSAEVKNNVLPRRENFILFYSI